jgi:hypothetical protein
MSGESAYKLDLYLRALAEISADTRVAIAAMGLRRSRDRDLAALAEHYLRQGASAVSPETGRAYFEIGQSILALLSGPADLWGPARG